MADFSLLPDVIWVNILSYLSLSERSNVAKTCSILNDVFHHPSLWHSVSINLLCGSQRYLSSDVLLPVKYVKLVEQFGKYFQNLELKMTGYLNEIPPKVQHVIQTLGKQCRLEKLTLSIGTVLSKRDFFWERPDKLDISGIFVLIENTYRLKALNILAWPVHNSVHSPNILHAIKRNEKIKDVLEHLNLFWKSADQTSWVTMNANLPSPADTTEMLQHFHRSLKTLKLQSTMISDDLILELGKPHRRSLEKLSILVTYSKHLHESSLPEISNKAWHQLKVSSPDLVVDFSFVTRIPYIELAGLLKPEIPVSAINFMRYSDCRAIDLQSIADKYSKTLIQFSDYSQNMSGDNDDALLDLVVKCEKMNYFVYDGKIHCDTVTHLAKLRRLQWYYFQVNTANVVVTKKITAVENQDSYSQMKVEHDPLTREACIEIMIQEVAEYIGQKWIPIDWLMREDIDIQREKLYNKDKLNQ